MSVAGGLVVGIVFASLFAFFVAITIVWCAYNIIRFGTPSGRRRLADNEAAASRRAARDGQQRPIRGQIIELQSPTTKKMSEEDERA